MCVAAWLREIIAFGARVASNAGEVLMRARTLRPSRRWLALSAALAGCAIAQAQDRQPIRFDASIDIGRPRLDAGVLPDTTPPSPPFDAGDVRVPLEASIPPMRDAAALPPPRPARPDAGAPSLDAARPLPTPRPDAAVGDARRPALRLPPPGPQGPLPPLMGAPEVSSPPPLPPMLDSGAEPLSEQTN